MKIHDVELDPVSLGDVKSHSSSNHKPISDMGNQELQARGKESVAREPKGLGRSAAKKMAYAEKAKIKSSEQM